MDAAQRFFRSARSMSNVVPTQVTTDGHDSYPRAIQETLVPKVKHRCSAYMNRRIERNHREVKQRYYPMLGFGALPSAQRFWRAFEEVRQYFRPRRKQNDVISYSQKSRTASESSKMRKPPARFRLGPNQNVTEVRERFAVLYDGYLNQTTMRDLEFAMDRMRKSRMPAIVSAL